MNRYYIKTQRGNGIVGRSRTNPELFDTRAEARARANALTPSLPSKYGRLIVSRYFPCSGCAAPVHETVAFCSTRCGDANNWGLGAPSVPTVSIVPPSKLPSAWREASESVAAERMAMGFDAGYQQGRAETYEECASELEQSLQEHDRG